MPRSLVSAVRAGGYGVVILGVAMFGTVIGMHIAGGAVPTQGGQTYGALPANRLPDVGTYTYSVVAQAKVKYKKTTFVKDLVGTVGVQVGARQPAAGQTDKVPLTFTGFNLQGYSTASGPVSVSLASTPSTGTITEITAGQGFPSIMNVSLNLDYKIKGQTLTTKTPVNETSTLMNWPVGSMDGGNDPVDLVDDNGDEEGTLYLFDWEGVDPSIAAIKGEILDLEEELDDVHIDIHDGFKFGNAEIIKDYHLSQKILARLQP
jgi:hypothetical protein